MGRKCCGRSIDHIYEGRYHQFNSVMLLHFIKEINVTKLVTHTKSLHHYTISTARHGVNNSPGNSLCPNGL